MSEIQYTQGCRGAQAIAGNCLKCNSSTFLQEVGVCDLIWVFSGNRSLTPIRPPAGASRDGQFLRGGAFPFLYSSSSSYLSGPILFFFSITSLMTDVTWKACT